MSNKTARDRADAIRLGLGFTFRHWARHTGWVAFILGVLMVSTAAEMTVPIFAGRLTDALNRGVAGRDAALAAFASMTALTLLPVIFGRAAIFGIIGLTLRIMQAVGGEAFHRVQRLSTDWHANSFSGSVVRKITRGMWALDLLDDVLLLGISARSSISRSPCSSLCGSSRLPPRSPIAGTRRWAAYWRIRSARTAW